MKSILVFFLSVTLVISGCTSTPVIEDLPNQHLGWNLNHLLFFDSPNNPSNLNTPIAVYYRQSPQKFQVRVDFLDLLASSLPNLKIKMSFQKQFMNIGKDPFKRQPLILMIEPGNKSNPIMVDDPFASRTNPTVNILWLYDMDYLTLEVEQQDILSNYILSNIQLEIPATSMEDPPPLIPPINNQPLINPGHASVLLEFWNIFPGKTPAQTLRRWDGAHTGPFGQRHGLKYLLDSASTYQIPIFLLDLKKPASLAALANLQQINRLHELGSIGLITLPDVGYGDSDFVDKSVAMSREISSFYGMPVENILFAPLRPDQINLNNHTMAFASGIDPFIHQSNNLKLIPLPQSFPGANSQINSFKTQELDEYGLTLQAKIRLIESAAKGTSGELILFGGDFSDSPWADSRSGKLAMEFLASHPWINVLSKNELLSLPSVKEYNLSNCSNILCSSDPFPANAISALLTANESIAYHKLVLDIRTSILSLPDDDFSRFIWQRYFELTDNLMSPIEFKLKIGYLEVLGHLIEAGKWDQNPYERAACGIDLDWDNENECILSTSAYFSSYENNGASITTLLTKTDNHLKLLISPTSLFAVGLSDPAEWVQPGNRFIDPGEVPGAFSELNGTDREYISNLSANRLTFSSLDGEVKKTYISSQNSLEVQYFTKNLETTRIPILISSNNPVELDGLNTFVLGNFSISNQQIIKVENASLSVDSAFDSASLMSSPENPSFGYPTGHFLPYPFSVYTVSGQDNYSVLLSLDPNLN